MALIEHGVPMRVPFRGFEDSFALCDLLLTSRRGHRLRRQQRLAADAALSNPLTRPADGPAEPARWLRLWHSAGAGAAGPRSPSCCHARGRTPDARPSHGLQRGSTGLFGGSHVCGFGPAALDAPAPLGLGAAGSCPWPWGPRRAKSPRARLPAAQGAAGRRGCGAAPAADGVAAGYAERRGPQRRVPGQL